jgi:hypothetical protein
MADPTFMDKALFWINAAYIASVCLTLTSGFLVLYLTYQRNATTEAESRRLQLESAQHAAAANERAAAATEAAQRAQVEAAATAAAGEKMRQENLELALALEREKRMRLEMEDRLSRQPAPAASLSTGEPRMLTLDEERELATAMRSFRGTRASLLELSDVEAGSFARDFLRVLNAAQWNVTVNRIGALVPPQYGVVITHDANNPAAPELVKTLRSFGLTVYERKGTPGQFEILIGLKPLRDR